MVQVVAHTTALDTSSLLHDITLSAVNTSIGSGPSTGGAEAVAGLAIVTTEELSVLAGDRTAGSLEA